MSFKTGDIVWKPDYCGEVANGLAIKCILIERLVEDDEGYDRQQFTVEISSYDVVELDMLNAKVKAMLYIPSLHKLYKTKEEAQIVAIRERRNNFSIQTQTMDQIQAEIEGSNDT